MFSLHDEDLGYSDQLTHTILTSTDKPEYLPNRTILRQLQGDVHKCLNTWLCQRIICPSSSFYASQVVTLHKESGEIHLCVDYRKLNSITILDAFLLPHIDKAPQVVHSSNVFTSFALVQGYLQLATTEADIKKTTFRAGSSGLYEFTHMAFGLLNARSSFYRLMEQCLGDQQFVTLLLYLDDISIFAPDVSTMFDHIKLVFNCLKPFHLKIKQKNVIFPGQHDFRGHVLSANGISANPGKVDKVRDWLVPKKAKELHSFLDLASYYSWFIPNFAHMANYLHQLIGPTNVKKNKSKKQKVKKEVTILEKTGIEQTNICWTSEHQVSFNVLKIALTTAPVLGYPNITREFILEADISLKWLGAVLSKQDDAGKVHVTAYARQTLKPYEQSMCNYRLA